MKRVLMLCVFLLTLTAPSWAAEMVVGPGTWVWTDGNSYIVNGIVEIPVRVSVRGSVTLILSDDCKLNALKGIEVPGATA